jgi:hypothetical protein
VSDGTGTPATAYNYAKNTAHLDFFSLADHCTSISTTEWTDIKNQANNYNQDGVFTALWGFEWSSNGNYGHITINNTDDYCTASSSATNTFTELCTWLSTRNGVAFFNHPGREDDLGREFDHFNNKPAGYEKFVGMELWNKSDPFAIYYYTDGYFSSDNNKSWFDEALSRGWKIGAAGADDNHDGTWGTRNDYRLAILADTLTRASLLSALQARRFYTTLDKNIALSFKINSSEMGSTIAGGNSTVQVLATDGNGELFTEVKLFDKNHNTVNTWTISTATVNISYNLTTASGDYYYVKIKQADGNEAISSPVFIFGMMSVTLSAFNAASTVNGININWRTESENNSFCWAIERSLNEADYYIPIAKIPAHGQSNSPVEYLWTDSTVSPGNRYLYRLKETDLFGETTFYGPIAANCLESPLKAGFVFMTTFPNPFISKTLIAYHIQNNNSKVTINIYDICGQQVKNWPPDLKTTGNHQFIWDGSDNNHRMLPAGIYIVKLKVDNDSYYKKISKLN